MATSLCTNRLRKELRALQKNPVTNIRALPRESNILEWHYVIEGTKGTPFEGGWYHGIVTFPKEYPYKPPSIQMVTPNGRFKTSTSLCLSMSDFHPESWNPLWSVGTILMGLHSFMLEHTPTQGSITTTDAAKRKLAAESLEFNTKNKVFRELFPELVRPPPLAYPPAWRKRFVLLKSANPMRPLLALPPDVTGDSTRGAGGGEGTRARG